LKLMKWLRAWLRRFLGLDELLEAVRYRPALPPPPPPPPLFVAVWAIGLGPRGPVSLGACGDASKPIELHTNVPLDEVQVIVFADMQRVQVGGIFCGVDLVNASVGACPVGYFPRWEVGVKVWVVVSVAR